WWKTLFAAVIPQAVPAMTGSTLYLLDVNIRTSTILGIVGAGGIGYLLFESIRTLNFDVAGAIVIVVFAIVYAIEGVPGWRRARAAARRHPGAGAAGHRLRQRSAHRHRTALRPVPVRAGPRGGRRGRGPRGADRPRGRRTGGVVGDGVLRAVRTVPRRPPGQV